MPTARTLGTLSLFLGLTACGAAGDHFAASTCAPGAFTCDEGCCELCRTHADCPMGTGCDESRGQCTSNADPCSALRCDAPPDASCVSPTTLRRYDGASVCDAGACAYLPTDITCDKGCDGGACVVCQPSSCAELGFACGAHTNGCGATVDCGSCGAGEICTVEGRCACGDADGDGFASTACGGDDCNDGDATVHRGAVELCDAIDNDCSGVVDDVVTEAYTTAAWVPAGFFGLPAGTLIIDGPTAAWWDPVKGGITASYTLDSVWDYFGKNGDQPPAEPIDSIMMLPAGTNFGEPQPNDQVVVTAGETAYIAEGGFNIWWSTPVSALYFDTARHHRVFPTDSVDAAVFVRAADLGLAGDLLLVVANGVVRAYDGATECWGPPRTVAEFFYPAGSGGTPPTGVSSLLFTPATPGYFVLQHGAASQISAVSRSPTTGTFVFSWMPFAMAALACVP
jgi:hypothetical protein